MSRKPSRSKLETELEKAKSGELNTVLALDAMANGEVNWSCWRVLGRSKNNYRFGAFLAPGSTREPYVIITFRLITNKKQQDWYHVERLTSLKKLTKIGNVKSTVPILLGAKLQDVLRCAIDHAHKHVKAELAKSKK